MQLCVTTRLSPYSVMMEISYLESFVMKYCEERIMSATPFVGFVNYMCMSGFVEDFAIIMYYKTYHLV